MPPPITRLRVRWVVCRDRRQPPPTPSTVAFKVAGRRDTKPARVHEPGSGHGRCLLFCRDPCLHWVERGWRDSAIKRPVTGELVGENTVGVIPQVCGDEAAQLGQTRGQQRVVFGSGWIERGDAQVCERLQLHRNHRAHPDIVEFHVVRSTIVKLSVIHRRIIKPTFVPCLGETHMQVSAVRCCCIQSNSVPQGVMITTQYTINYQPAFGLQLAIGLLTTYRLHVGYVRRRQVRRRS